MVCIRVYTYILDNRRFVTKTHYSGVVIKFRVGSFLNLENPLFLLNVNLHLIKVPLRHVTVGFSRSMSGRH